MPPILLLGWGVFFVSFISTKRQMGLTSTVNMRLIMSHLSYGVYFAHPNP